MISADIDFTEDTRYSFFLRRSTLDCIKPRVRQRTWDVLKDGGMRTHKGEPFNPMDFPWCEGICDAWDDPDVREVVMQFSARIGKTVLAQSLMIADSWQDPATGMFATATEKLLMETIKDKYYPMFEKFKGTRKLVPKQRTQTRIDLANMRIYGAWGGSISGLADKDPKRKHGGEVSKWTKNRSDEADPLALFMQRGVEIPDRKTILESTPGTEGRCRINEWLLRGTNCRFQLPCPRCGHHQPLILGDGTGAGVIWDKDADGNHSSLLALNTARYRCEKCRKEIHEDERRPMIRKGVWCPQGCWVDKKGRLKGTPMNPKTTASFQIWRAYAPTFTFGDVAAAYVEALKPSGDMQDFVNSVLAEVWSPRKIMLTWEQVGQRLATNQPPRRIPKQCYFVTMAVDVQVDHYVWIVVAWDSTQAGYVVDYGTCNTDEELKTVWQTAYEHDDGGPPLRAILTLMDARDGNRVEEIGVLCKSWNDRENGPWVWPSMGTATRYMRGKTFERHDSDEESHAKRKKTKRRAMPGFFWVSVNTNYWQEWLQNCLGRRSPGSPGSLSLPSTAIADQDFLEQLLNEQPEKKTDTTGHQDTIWVVLHEHIPHDFRDAMRYARCGAEVFVNGNWNRVPEKRRFDPNWKANQAVREKQAAEQQAKPAATQKKPGWLPKIKKQFIRGGGGVRR